MYQPREANALADRAGEASEYIKQQVLLNQPTPNKTIHVMTPPIAEALAQEAIVKGSHQQGKHMLYLHEALSCSIGKLWAFCRRQARLSIVRY